MARKHGLGAIAVAALVAFAALPVSGCGEEEVEGLGVGIDDTAQGLAANTIASVDGTYTTCSHRSGAWSVRISGAQAMTNAPLTVVLNDTACVLTVTAIMSTTGVIWPATTPFALTGSYQVSPPWFNTNTFYANAKLSAVGFAADFVISVLYSDDQNLVTGANTATLQSEVATATAASVPAPNYTISLAGIAITTDVNDVVFSQSGTAALTAGSQVGQTYVVVTTTGLTTYAAIDAAYLAGGTPKTIASTIPVADFALTTGTSDLTGGLGRSLIIANTANGVRSYERFAITFNAAP